MSPKAGQTAGLNGLKFLYTLMGGWGCFRLKNIRIYFSKFYFHGQRWALQLVSNMIWVRKSTLKIKLNKVIQSIFK